MKKLSAIPAPALAGVIREKSEFDAIEQIRKCEERGADMLDLHLSCLESADENMVGRIISSTSLPILALNYNQKCDWSDAGYDENARAESFRMAVGLGASGVDIQGYSFDINSKHGFTGEDKYSFTKNNPKEVVTDERVIKKQAEFIEEIHSLGAEVLLSCHPGIVMSATAVVELALFLRERNPDIIKIVTRADTEADLEESILAMSMLKKALDIPVAYHTNGRKGVPSRIINPILGGQIAFCVAERNAYSTPEQIELTTAREVVDLIRRIK